MAKGRKTGGKVKGSVNKRTKEFLAVLEQHNFCPASAMIAIHKEAMKTYENYGVIYDAICDAKEEKEGYSAPVQDNAHTYLKIAGDMAKEISSYAYAKRKAIEQTIDPALVETIKSLEGKSEKELLDIVNSVRLESQSD
jgi:hypothetical protein